MVYKREVDCGIWHVTDELTVLEGGAQLMMHYVKWVQNSGTLDVVTRRLSAQAHAAIVAALADDCEADAWDIAYGDVC